MLDPLLSAIFSLIFASNSAAAAGCMKFLYLLPLSKKSKEYYSLAIITIFWRFTFSITPWIRIRTDKSSQECWKTLRAKVDESDAKVAAGTEKFQPVIVFANHTSFLDVPLSLCLMPSWLIWRARTYMGNFLFKIPILSTICHSVGHFPVYFSSSELGVFKVDNERMAAVEKAVDKHMEDGGFMTYFPEGQVNKKTPDTILDFRYGGMKKALECNARIAFVVMYGNPKVWPANAQVSGRSGVIRWAADVVAADGCQAYVKKLREAGLPEDERELPDHAIMAKYMRNHMQKIYDKLKAEATGGRIADKKSD
eukprot:TRINITY_DN32517_c0_g1_i1.p1 TRINITY_DN32517_c0_g1~~TRINITY_DN32517_c0_g1_i1.p1  ORF type:complete len:310 (+),score=65.68 TRINITY_DN32517_c0_g1_i1:89-1018(+)